MSPSSWQANSANHITVLGLSCRVLQHHSAFYRERREEASDSLPLPFPCVLSWLCTLLHMMQCGVCGLTGVRSWDSWFMVSSLPLISVHNLGHITANSHLWVGAEVFGMSWSEGSQLSVYSSTPALRYAWAPCWTASVNSKGLEGAGGWLGKATLQAVTFQHLMLLHQLRWGAGGQSEHPQELQHSAYTCFN